MAQERRNYNYTTYAPNYAPYVDGTAAPQLEPQPVRKPKRNPQHTSAPAKRSSSSISPAMLAFLIIATVALLGACIYLLSVQAEINTSQNKIESLQSELQTARANNDAKEVYLNKSIDLTEIYRVATEELGMVYPSEDQVVYYQRSDGGYVRQYEEIPTD